MNFDFFIFKINIFKLFLIQIRIIDEKDFKELKLIGQLNVTIHKRFEQQNMKLTVEIRVKLNLLNTVNS